MKNYENMTTDEIYVSLPVTVCYEDGHFMSDDYHLNIIPCGDCTIIEYRTTDGKYLASTRRYGKTLREAIIKMRNWLTEFNYQSRQEYNGWFTKEEIK